MGINVKAPVKPWSMASAIEQINKCAFECEGGSIDNNDAWRWLKAAAETGPEFWPGQVVWFEVCAEAAGIKLNQWVQFTIIGCAMSSDSDRRFWVYALSYDPPDAYHHGKVHFSNVKGDQLKLEKPSA